MKIVIESIPHSEHRYPTVGDYWRDEDGTLQIRVSDTGNVQDAVLVALHELVEVTLCENQGISEEEITAFDISTQGGPYEDDPGHCPDAPYHREHVFAECIERLVAQEMGVNWQDYEKRLLALDGKA